MYRDSAIFEDSSYELFYVLWALKESYVKAIGTGICIDLKQVISYYI